MHGECLGAFFMCTKRSFSFCFCHKKATSHEIKTKKRSVSFLRWLIQTHNSTSAPVLYFFCCATEKTPRFSTKGSLRNLLNSLSFSKKIWTLRKCPPEPVERRSPSEGGLTVTVLGSLRLVFCRGAACQRAMSSWDGMKDQKQPCR